jgi:hypothetical protein
MKGKAQEGVTRNPGKPEAAAFTLVANHVRQTVY